MSRGNKGKSNMSAPMRRIIFSGNSLFRLRNTLRKSVHHIKSEGRLCTRSSPGDKWQLISAVCLQRPPVITQDQNEAEKTYTSLTQQMELEYSLLSDHELRHLEDIKLEERRRSEDYEETEAEAVRQTALEAEDMWDSELANFHPADRLTEADRQNDMQSTDRKLDRRLVLLVKQKLGDEDHWVMPQGAWQEGESMRETAQRVLSDMCGQDLQARFMGNAPCGFFKYRFPQDKCTDEGHVGAKVFFFKAQLKEGQVNKSSPDMSAYQWVTKDELQQHITPAYWKALDRFLLEL